MSYLSTLFLIITDSGEDTLKLKLKLKLKLALALKLTLTLILRPGHSLTEQVQTGV